MTAPDNGHAGHGADFPLVVRDISVQFGGLRAVDKVSMEVRGGEIVGLIGSNGAGKTTLMDCISGFVPALPGGLVVSFGYDISTLRPELRPYRAMGRSYQDAHLFPGLTVEQALLVALERHYPTGWLSALLQLPWARRAERVKREWVDELIEMSAMHAFRDKFVGELSTGTRRIVDLMSIVAQGPRLLLLDEPSAGIAQAETEALGPLLLRIKEQLNCSVVLIEHDMPLVSSLADRIYALEVGRVIAEGTPQEVLSDPAVIASYLGTDEAAIKRSGVIHSEPAPPRVRARGGGARGKACTSI